MKLALEVTKHLGGERSGSAVQATRDACAALLRAERPRSPANVDGCSDALRALLDALGEQAPSADGVAADLTTLARALVSSALSRLSWWTSSSLARQPSAPADWIPAELLLSPDGLTVQVRPLRPLRSGRSYELVAEGPPETVDHLREGIASRAEPAALTSSRVEDLSRVLDATFGRRALAAHPDETRALVEKLASYTGAMRAISPSMGPRITMTQKVRGTDLGQVYAWFAPAIEKARAQSIARFRTVDPSSTLAGYRLSVARARCSGDASRPLVPIDLGLAAETIATGLRGSFASLRIVDPSAEQTLGFESAKTSPFEIPFFMVLPRNRDANTPLVLLMHGHGGRARALLKAHAADLTARGMAVAAFDLPAHGDRQGEQPFPDLLDPGRIANAIQQAAIDVLSFVHVAIECGFELPGGERFRPAELRYLGYSLGSMVGTLVRSVEPQLGTTVLIAPGGDIVDWQMVQLPKHLGADRYLICNEGAWHGDACGPRMDCAAPGSCIANPEVILLQLALRYPYALALAGVEPTSFASRRTGETSHAPLLLIAGGADVTLSPTMAGRLARAYGMKPHGPGEWRGPDSRIVWWPALGHGLITDPRVREQAYDFLSSRGHRFLQPPAATPRD